MRVVLLSSLALLLCLLRFDPLGAMTPDDLEPAPAGGAFWVAFSPDGKKLAVAGKDMAIGVYDWPSGQRRARLQGHTARIWCVAFSPDGRTLASCGGVFDRSTLPVSSPVGNASSRGLSLALLVGFLITLGCLLATRLVLNRRRREKSTPSPPNAPPVDNKHSSFSTLVMRSAGFVVLLLLGLGAVWWFVAQEDGAAPENETSQASANSNPALLDAGEVKLWDIEAARLIRDLNGHRGFVCQVKFSPDGKTVVSGGADGTIKFWDAATGNERQTLKAHSGTVRALLYSPDGKYLVSAGVRDGTARFWDPVSYQRRRMLMLDPKGAQAIAFSPDGRCLAFAGRTGDETTEARVGLCNLFVGFEQARFSSRFSGPVGRVLCVDMSPDGKMVAAGCGWGDLYGEVKLFEVVSGGERATLSKHKQWVECVQFSPDGQAVLCASAKEGSDLGELRIQRLAKLRMKNQDGPEALPPEHLQGLWRDLAEPDARQAYQAILTLQAYPGAAVSLLKALLHPAAPMDVQRLTRLIAALNDKDAANQYRAAKELEQIGELAEPALRQVLNGRAGGESRQRILNLLLKAAQAPGRDSERLRALRAIEVLEGIGNAEAQEALQALAQGAPESRVTQEAHLSLKRLSH